VPSKILPPRSTSVPSGPRGPGFTGMRRGSSLTAVFGSRNLRRSEAFSCAPASATTHKPAATNIATLLFIAQSSARRTAAALHITTRPQKSRGAALLRPSRQNSTPLALYPFLIFVPALHFFASSAQLLLFLARSQIPVRPQVECFQFVIRALLAQH